MIHYDYEVTYFYYCWSYRINISLCVYFCRIAKNKIGAYLHNIYCLFYYT